jgi:hypothetical protein
LLSFRKVNEKIAKIETFNDVSCFVSDLKNPSRFIFTPEGARTSAYLRFRIPNANLCGWQLKMRLKARSHVLKHLVVRSAREVLKKERGVIDGDVASFIINFEPEQTYMWDDGSCYVGVCADKGSSIFSPGDTIELLDFKFELK